MPDARQAPGLLHRSSLSSLPGQAFPDPQLSVATPAHGSLLLPLLSPSGRTYTLQNDLFTSVYTWLLSVPRGEFHVGSPLSVWFTVTSPAPRTVQAPTHCPGRSGLFAEWRGLAAGRRQRHRGSRPGCCPQELSGTAHAQHWTETIQGCSCFCENAGWEFRRGMLL